MKKESKNKKTSNIMEYLIVVPISFLIGVSIGVMVGIYFKLINKFDMKISETNYLLTDIKKEMGDIHNNVCPIEKRIRR